MKKIRRKLKSTVGRDEMLKQIRNMDHGRLTSIKEYPTYIDHQKLKKAVPKSQDWDDFGVYDFDESKSHKPTPPIPPPRTSIPPHLPGLKFQPPPLPRNLHPVGRPATRKYNADRQGVIQKISDISMTNSTFQADIIKAPHVKVETFVCCSIHIGDTECDCKKSLKKKSKMKNLVKIVRGTSFVLGTYILYHLHDIFDYD